MSGKNDRKQRQLAKRNWKSYLKDIRELGFWTRVRMAWWLVFGKISDVETKVHGQFDYQSPKIITR